MKSYLVSFTIAVKAVGVPSVIDGLVDAVQRGGVRDIIGSAGTDYMIVSVNEQLPDTDDSDEVGAA